MKKHTTEQIIRKLREAKVLASQGKDTAAICQALEISSQTYHRWKARYGRLDGDEAKRLDVTILGEQRPAVHGTQPSV